MSEEKINNALEELRREVERLEVGDSEARERLTNLIENLEQNLKPSEVSEDGHQGLIDDVKEVVTHFEVEHPRVTGILNDIMMTLSNMGI